MLRAGKSPEEMVAFVRSRINSTADNRSGGKIDRPEKRTFIGFLRHPLKKPEPKPVPNLRLRTCLKGWCRVCPIGAGSLKGQCVETIANNLEPLNRCSHRQIWRGDACLQQTNFLDECSGERAALDVQAMRMQAAESARQSACTVSTTQECTEATNRAQSESSLYRSLQEKYQQCMRLTRGTRAPTGRTVTVSPHPLSDPLQIELDDH